MLRLLSLAIMSKRNILSDNCYATAEKSRREFTQTWS